MNFYFILLREVCPRSSRPHNCCVKYPWVLIFYKSEDSGPYITLIPTTCENIYIIQIVLILLVT